MIKAIASRKKKTIDKWSSQPGLTQQKVFNKLIKTASITKFGLDHNFNKIKSYSDYAKNTPIRDYEDFKSYIELIKKGEKDKIKSYFASFQSILMKATKSGTINKKTASRKISKISKKI